MRLRRVRPVAGARVAAALAVALTLGGATPSRSGPTLGFREDWAGTSVDGWGGGSTSYSNPGSGGADGAGDGYLLVTQAADGNFGTRSVGSEYTGDWVAAGIGRVLLSLNDVGAPDALEIHLAIGNTSNLWQYNAGFTPPSGAWQEFAVDLSDASKFTQIAGSGTFTEALQFADRILLRNDSAPYVQAPDPAHGDFAIDRVMLTAVSTRTRASTWGRIKALYR